MPTMDISATLPRVAMADVPQNHGCRQSVGGMNRIPGGTGIGGHRHGDVG